VDFIQIFVMVMGQAVPINSCTELWHFLKGSLNI